MPPNPETQRLLADYIKSEIVRAKSQLNTNLWDAIMVGVSDQGEVAVPPCRLILPFHYPATQSEAKADSGPDHFDFPDQWKPKYVNIPEFEQQYDLWSAIDDATSSAIQRSSTSAAPFSPPALADRLFDFYSILGIPVGSLNFRFNTVLLRNILWLRKPFRLHLLTSKKASSFCAANGFYWTGI